MKKGFTLIEVIFAVAIFSLIVAVVSYFAVYYFQSYAFSFEEQQVISEAEGSLTRIIREIRNARQGEDGSWPLVQTDNSTFVFYADVTGDQRVDKVRYFVSTNKLQRGVIEPTLAPISYPTQNEKVMTLVNNIDATTSAIFQYYNGNWPADQINNPLTASQRILNTRYIRVTIRLNPTPNFSAKPFELSTGVSIRSMKDNL